MMNKYIDAEAADIGMVESMATEAARGSGNDESMDEEVAADSGKFGSSIDEEAAEKMDYKDESIVLKECREEE
jgi:hypothetical protein